MSHVVVVGSSTTDIVVPVAKFPSPGETVIGSPYKVFSGGKGANQAVMASRCGAEVHFVGRIGTDYFGNLQVQSLESAGIHTGSIYRDRETPAAVAMISLLANGENAIVVSPGSNHKLTMQDIDAAIPLLEHAEMVLLQLEIPHDVTCHIINRCYELDLRMILDPAPAADLPLDVLRKVEIITPNEREITALVGMKTDNRQELAKAGRYLTEKGINNVVITIGGDGIIWCTPESVRHYPAFRVNAVDTTGAGDTFNGALAYALINGYQRDDACNFAQAAAALSTTRYGAQDSIPERWEIDEFLQSAEMKP